METFTVHNAATWVLEDEPWNLAAFYYPGIDHFSHGFMNCHPPQMPGVSDEHFARYAEVVNGAYRLHDLMLGRLIGLAGPNTTVILLSDHGFHSDHLRPKRIPAEPVGPAVQHRDHGILVMSGAGLKRDERIYGAGLLDITPTVLTLLGLPVGGDMPGRVLVDAFEETPAISTIPSWEQLDGAGGRHPAGFVAPSYDQSLVMEQFAALGYLNLDEMQGAMGPAACRRENQWSLARSLFNSGQHDRVVDILLPLCHEWPERGDFALVLAEALSRLGLAAEARRLIETLVSADRRAPAAQYLLGIAALEERRYADALDHLRAVGPEYSHHAELNARMGNAYLRLGNIADAERAHTRAIEIDPHLPAAWLGLTRCAIRRRDWNAAEEHALRAIGLEFQKPLAHALLGFARLRLKKTSDADLALRIACRQAPGWVFPRRLRVMLWKSSPGAELEEAVADLEGASTKQADHLVRRLEFASPSRREQLERLRLAYDGRFRPAAADPSPPIDPSPLPPPIDTVVVTGLPRSGTSLMMQMLQAGSAQILTDGQRSADDDNPEGYLEWEPIKNLPSRPEILRQADRKVIKIISPLLPYLPPRHRYTVVFMDRPVDEILRSQERMRERRGQAVTPDLARLRTALTAHRDQIVAKLHRNPNVQLLIVPYPQLVEYPDSWVEKIATLLGERLAHPNRLASVVRPELYRNRAKLNNSSPTTSGALTHGPTRQSSAD